jgi:hypothetical protein
MGYTALSRARQQTTLHLIAGPSAEDQERSGFAPATSAPSAADALAALGRRMSQSETEPLAVDHHVLRTALSPHRLVTHLPSTSPPRRHHSQPIMSAPGPTVHR